MQVLYRYDTASRLTKITYLGAVTNRIDYTYDPAGNRSSQASGFSMYNLPSAVPNSLYDAANHQLTFGSYSMLYDLNGNVTNIINGATVNNLAWNARNQLTNMTGAATATFAYDGVGRRITRTIGSTTEKYAYDGFDIIQQLDNAGTVGANYFRGLAIDEPWQRIDVGSASTNRIYLADALGSAVALADTNKTLQTQYAYEPFGATTSTGVANKNSYEFTARENDGTGLYYYRARYYNPALGRFVSEDPAQFVVGGSFYTMVGNDPLDYIDPLGLFQWTITIGDGWGGQFTFGRNGGQWNIGLRGGVGGPFSITYNPKDAGCQDSGFSMKVIGSGKIGTGMLELNSDLEVNNQDPVKITLTGAVPYIKKLGFGVEITPSHVDNPFEPTASIDVVGGSAGVFGGPSYYFQHKCGCK